MASIVGFNFKLIYLGIVLIHWISTCSFVLADETITVQTPWGLLNGSYDAELNITRFLGVPFAKPPVGELRWQPPKKLENWTGVWDATQVRDECAQPNGTPTFGGSEDCLYLYLWVPGHAGPREVALPVLVYLHGGGNIFGSAKDPFSDASNLVSQSQNVVAVSVEYRMNIFGFLALDQLTKESPNRSSGNYGLMDALEALRWVQQGIASFGGDIERVLLYGQSSGGTNVLALLMSPHLNGLAHAVVSWSGSPKIDQQLEVVQAQNQEIMQQANCTDLKCMRALSTQQLIDLIPWKTGPWWDMSQQMGEVTPPPHQVSGGLVIVDGHVVPWPSWIGFSTPELLVDIPAIISVTEDEIDLSPQLNVRNWTDSQWRALLNASFSWHSPNLAERVFEIYPVQDYVGGMQHMWESQVNDVRVYCGNRQLVDASCRARPGRQFLTMSRHAPAGGRCAYLPPWQQQFPYHMSDMISFFGTLKPTAPCRELPEDEAYGEVWRAAVLALAQDPTAASLESLGWNPYCNALETVEVSAAGVTPTMNLRLSQCQFWESIYIPQSQNSFVREFSWNN